MIWATRLGESVLGPARWIAFVGRGLSPAADFRAGRKARPTETALPAMDFTAQLQAYRARAEQAVQDFRPRHGPVRLNEATDYALAAGGKRLRPILLLAPADLLGVREFSAEPAAATVE